MCRGKKTAAPAACSTCGVLRAECFRLALQATLAEQAQLRVDAIAKEC